MRIRSDRTYGFPVEPPTVWANLGRVDEYQDWWPWLREFDAGPVETGGRWACLVKPPVPWSIRVVVRITDAVAPRLIAADITGDVAGAGQVEIRPTEEGSELRIRSSLTPASPLLRTAALLAAPLSRFGHDWVLDSGARQFRSHIDPSR